MRVGLFTRFLIIFSMLSAQLGGLTHGIAHVLSEQTQSGDQSPADGKHCNLCDAYAQIAGAIGSNTINFTPYQNFCGVEQNIAYSFSSIASFPFSARAPPYSA